jgi:PEP-CTERM motif
MKTTTTVLAAALVAAAFVSPKANAANLILNGGFEGGVQSVTIGGFTNNSVPNDWTPNAAFVEFPSFNGVFNNNIFHTGSFSLQIGNFDNQPLASLSQTFSDVPAATYTVAFFFRYDGVNDPGAFLTVSAGGQSVTETSLVQLPFTSATFTFTGTGSDTLTIAATTNPAEWYVDDVSVNGSTVGPGVPEPSTWAMMLLGFAGLGLAFRNQRKVLRAATRSS